MRTMRSRQEGVMLLEALIGILIFSLGVLALVAMQAVSISSVSNARYRTEAAFLANDILGVAWVDRGVCPAPLPAPAVSPPCVPNTENYRYPGGSAAALVPWVQKVQAALPGSDAFPPTIEVAPIEVVPTPDQPVGRRITVTLQWRAPDAVMTSRHVAVGYVTDAVKP